MIILEKTYDRNNEFDMCDVKMTIANDDISLTQLLEQIELFLKACGYVFTGELDIFGGERDE